MIRRLLGQKTGAAVLGFAVVLVGCNDGTYVIGRFLDDGCASHQDAIFCSGFERPDLSDWSRVIVVNDAHVEQTETRSFEGRGALHAASEDQQSTAVVAKEFDPVTSGELYLRTHLYVPGGLPTRTMNIFFLGDFATPDPFEGVDFNLEDGALSTYVPHDSPDRFTSTTLTIPRDRWFCMQVHMTVADGDGALTIDVDGQTGLDEKGMHTLPPGGIHLLRAGIDWSSLQTDPFDYYIDDLVLSRTAVDCDDPSP
ncbi:MAG TPA: hypothetical protein VH062_04960 [Polyangiaceae bacterium]|nr:hypothetical protein [Polyangiaceae bacterium]